MGVIMEDFHTSGQVPLFSILENKNDRGELSSKDNAFSSAFGILSDDLLNLFGRNIRNFHYTFYLF